MHAKLLLLLLLICQNVLANDDTNLSKYRATKTLELLAQQSVICCAKLGTDTADMYIQVDSVYMREANRQFFYQVIVEGTTEQGNAVCIIVDIANIYVQQNEEGICAAKLLRFVCLNDREYMVWSPPFASIEPSLVLN